MRHVAYYLLIQNSIHLAAKFLVKLGNLKLSICFGQRSDTYLALIKNTFMPCLNNWSAQEYYSFECHCPSCFKILINDIVVRFRMNILDKYLSYTINIPKDLCICNTKCNLTIKANIKVHFPIHSCGLTDAL